MSSATKGQRIIRIALVLCSSLSTASVFGRNPIAFSVPFEWRGGGVDLGAIGRFFGLDPATVRLNGHFLSRGSDFISSVTWDSLISFFSARGFPAGESDRDPIVVQGKPYVAPGLHSASDLEDGDHLSFKRKIRLEDESPSKKNRVFEENSGQQEVKNGVMSDDESICIGRRMKLDDNHTSKKPKVSKCNSGLACEASKLPIFASSTGFTYNCINGLGKRLREDEMAVPISCKRIK